MTISLEKKMLDRFGQKELERPASRSELYKTVDIMTETIQALTRRLDDLEKAPIRYRGVWQKSDDYKRGNVVTDAGSAWHAVKDIEPGERPGSSDAWQLMIKGGR